MTKDYGIFLLVIWRLEMALQNCCIQDVNKYLQDIYYIPAYQRGISWNQANAQILLKDVTTSKKFLASNGSPYV